LGIVSQLSQSGRRGPPLLDDAKLLTGDVFLFNGQRLVPMCEIGPASSGCDADLRPFPIWATTGTRYYRLQRDSLHARFFWMPSRTSWRVQLPGAHILEFAQPLTVAVTSPNGPVDNDASVDYDTVFKSSGIPPRLVTDPRALFRWNIARHFTSGIGGSTSINVIVYR
jgi:hypothetical protein